MSATAVRLILKVANPSVLSGESLPVQVTAVNSGSSAASVRSEVVSPLVFEFLSEENGRVLYTRSNAENLASMRAGRPGVPLPVTEIELAPGASLTYDEDPPSYSMVAIPPGSYFLAAKLSLPGNPPADPFSEPGQPVWVWSEQVAITVQEPKLGRIAALYDSYEAGMAMALEHIEPDGEVWILQRQTPTERANDGVFHRRKQFAQSPDGLAIAGHAGPRLQGRWLAWLQGGSLAGLLGSISAVTAWAEPVSVDLDSPRLLEIGFQLPDTAPENVWVNSRALFVVAGTSGGAAAVQFCTLGAGGSEKFDVQPLDRALPERILARCTPLTNTVHLVWTERTPSGTQIWVREFRMDGIPREDPLLLMDTPAPLAAWELEPLGLSLTGKLHALFGPVEYPGKGPRMSYARIPLDSATAAKDRFDIPGLPYPVERFTISGMDTGNLIVVAKTRSGPWRLSDEELLDAERIAARMSDEKDPLPRFLYERMPDADKAFLRQHHSPDDLRAGLVRVLNRMLESGQLCDSQHPSEAFLTEQDRKRLAKGLQGEPLIRLGRLLLEATYPDEIAKVPRGELWRIPANSPDPIWTCLRRDTPFTPVLHVQASTHWYWSAVWVDAELGLDYAPDPNYIRGGPD